MISTNISRVDYKGDGSTTEFPIPFPFIEKSDISVYLVKNGEETLLDQNYYIDEINKTVTYPGYPPGEEKAESERPEVLPEGSKLVITRDIEITQERSLGEIWPFNEAEKGLDKITMILQDMNGQLKRTLKISLGADANGFNPTFPYPEEGKTIIWHNGKLENTDFKDLLTELTTRAEKAAEAAERSEKSAANYLEVAEDKKKEIIQLSNDLMDSDESALEDQKNKCLEEMDTYVSNSKSEITDMVSEAKHYSETAKLAAKFDPDLYYQKKDLDEIVKKAIQYYSEYDYQAF